MFIGQKNDKKGLEKERLANQQKTVNRVRWTVHHGKVITCGETARYV